MTLGSLQCPHCRQWHRSSEFCDCEGAKEARWAPYQKAIDRMKTKEPNAFHRAFRDDLLDALKKHAGDLDASEMMALAAYTVGQIMAMQDARKWTAAAAMEIVARNIELGNAQAIDDADKWMGRA